MMKVRSSEHNIFIVQYPSTVFTMNATIRLAQPNFPVVDMFPAKNPTSLSAPAQRGEKKTGQTLLGEDPKRKEIKKCERRNKLRHTEMCLYVKMLLKNSGAQASQEYT